MKDIYRKQNVEKKKIGKLIKIPSGSNILGISKYFSATSKAVFKFSSGLSLVKRP